MIDFFFNEVGGELFNFVIGVFLLIDVVDNLLSSIEKGWE